MKGVCIAYADKSGNGFSVSEPWIEDNFNTRKTYLRSLFMRIIPKRNWQHLILNSQRLLKF